MIAYHAAHSGWHFGAVYYRRSFAQHTLVVYTKVNASCKLQVSSIHHVSRYHMIFQERLRLLATSNKPCIGTWTR